MFLAGSWGADFHPDLVPQEGDTVLLPHKSIDVFETDLPEHLKKLGTTHLVIAGMTANLCCEGTGRHAMERGYDVTFISDAIGSTDIPSYEASIHINYPMVANGIMKTEEFLTAIESAQTLTQLQKGDTVLGSDHGEIGTVDEVIAGSDTHEPYVLVRKGLLLKKDIYVPLEAIVRRSGSKVFINVPNLIVGKMPWDEPPTRQETKEKQGDPFRQVEKIYRSSNPTSTEVR